MKEQHFFWLSGYLSRGKHESDFAGINYATLGKIIPGKAGILITVQ